MKNAEIQLQSESSLGDEDIEKLTNLAEENRASIINAKKAEQQRKRRAEMKSSNPEIYENHLANRRVYQRKRYEEMKNAEIQLQSESSLGDEDIEKLTNLAEENRASIINAKKAEQQRKRRAEMKSSNPEIYENHLANRRDYQRKRYEEMKNAEIQLQSESSLGNEDIEKLTNLANKRRKLIHANTVYQQTNKQSRWVQVPQEWDEEYPCQ